MKRSKYRTTKRLFYAGLIFTSLSLCSAGFASWQISGMDDVNVNGSFDVGDIHDTSNYVNITDYSLTPYCEYGFENNGTYGNNAIYEIHGQFINLPRNQNITFKIVLINSNSGDVLSNFSNYKDLQTTITYSDANIVANNSITASQVLSSFNLTTSSQQIGVINFKISYNFNVDNFESVYNELKSNGLSFQIKIYIYFEGGVN